MGRFLPGVVWRPVGGGDAAGRRVALSPLVQSDLRGVDHRDDLLVLRDDAFGPTPAAPLDLRDDGDDLVTGTPLATVATDLGLVEGMPEDGTPETHLGNLAAFGV